MPSLREKLKAIKPSAAPSATRPVPQDCFVRETRFPFDMYTVLPDGLLSFMQGDEEIPEHISSEHILFLDTETTGLSRGAGTVAFLVGVGVIRDKELIVKQYLMRDYDEEYYVLKHVQRDLDDCDVLVTYNGRAFDMPLLASRFIMQRMHVDTDVPHADLLHTARRVWKLRLKNCSLSYLEELIFHDPREDDIPGAEIPGRYFDYLKHHDFSLLEDILHHNALDIFSLARLLYTLSDLHQDPMHAEHLQDIFSLGRIFDKRGRSETARTCYRAADAGSMSAMSRLFLAANLRRARQPEEAAKIYRKMIASGQGGAQPYIALCKILEHQMNDIPSALDTAKRGLIMLSDVPASDPAIQAAFDDLTKRYARLMRKSRPHD